MLTINNFVTIKNYASGKNGNLLVSLVNDLKPVTVLSPKGKERKVEVLICTAKVPDELTELKSKIIELCDEDTSANASKRVILVSKKFLKMPNKMQLALLTIENEKLYLYQADRMGVIAESPETNMSGIISAEVLSVEKYGKWWTSFAMRKAKNVRWKSEKKASRGLHRAYKKQTKSAKLFAKQEKK